MNSEPAATAAPSTHSEGAPPDLTTFCREEEPRLIGALSLYTGDRYLAEELAQEALLAACRNWDRVRLMEAPGAWTHRAAMNLANSHFRRLRAERRALRRRDHEDSYVSPDIATAVPVRDAVAGLPADQRAAIVLRYYVDLSAEQTGEVLGRSAEAVRALTHRAIVALRASGLQFDAEANDV